MKNCTETEFIALIRQHPEMLETVIAMLEAGTVEDAQRIYDEWRNA